MHNIDFYLVGISNHPVPKFDTEIKQLLREHTVFSGGKRHYNLVRPVLPSHHQWIEISGPIPGLIAQYRLVTAPIVIFVSGDPLFYGFGNTLKRLLPKARLKNYPYFNAIQLLCHRTQINYNALKTVSLHGRTWAALDQALIKDEPLIGVLTDSQKNPATIAKYLLQYGFGHYRMVVGENLDGIDERIIAGPLEQQSRTVFAPLNCLLLSRQEARFRPFGLDDGTFNPLPNRPNMITKMAIRLNTLQACALSKATVFWDVGSCTGAVAIEAKRHYPHLEIAAIEKRKACGSIIQSNMEKFSTPGINIIIDDFFSLDLSFFSKPDVVFMGGHGNRLGEMIQRIYALNPEARLVTNAVQPATAACFKEVLLSLNFRVETTKIKVDGHNEIEILSGEHN